MVTSGYYGVIFKVFVCRLYVKVSCQNGNLFEFTPVYTYSLYASYTVVLFTELF